MLVWIDTETSGLVSSDKLPCLLEVAVVVTDDDLGVIDQKVWLVKPLYGEDKYDEIALTMHKDSGLLFDATLNGEHFEDVQTQIRAWLSMYVRDGESPLCGNSVHFDRFILLSWMPDLEASLHYRNIDVSSLKETMVRFFPAVDKFDPDAPKPHRALPDILHSIAEYRYYIDVIGGNT